MMEEERPLKEAREAIVGEPATVTPSERTSNRKVARGFIVAGGILVVVLLLAGLFLRPISLAQRLGFGGSGDDVVQATPDSGSDTGRQMSNDGIEGKIAVTADGNFSVTNVSPDDFTGSALPAGLTPTGELFVFDYDGDPPQGTLSLTKPAGFNVDLYGWDGSAWAFVPASHQDDQMITARMPMPLAVALVEADAADSLAIGADVQPEQSLPPAVLPYLTEVSVGRLLLQSDGSLEGEVSELATGAYKQLVSVTNVGAIVDQTAVTNLLSDEALVSQHIEDIVAAAADYEGVNLNYQGIPAAHRQNFTNFVTDLAAALQADDKLFVVTLGTPVHTQAGDWDTGGQAWQAIGRVADVVYLQLPLNPTVYAAGGEAQQLLDWAVTQIDRRKINAQVTTHAIETLGGTFRLVDSNEALANFGELSLIEGDEEIEPGTPIEVSLAGSASPLEWDGDSLMYRYTYEENGQTRTVWLNNEAAMVSQFRLADRYHVRGLTVTGLGSAEEAAGYADALQTIAEADENPELSGAAISWTVEAEDGAIIASSSGDSLTFRWEETDEPGEYTINAEFAQGATLASLGSLTVTIAEMEVAEEPTPEPTEEPEEETTGTGATIDPQPTRAPIDPGTADAAVGIAANLRRGPSVAYGVIEVVQVGTRVSLLGRNANAEWVQVAFDDKEGWIFTSLLSINAGVDVNALAVVEAPPPVAGGGGDNGGGTPLPAPPPPAATGNFELGGQTVGSPRTAVMNSAGMTWVKRQHKWGPGNTGQDVAGLVADGHANGFKVLLSIPGQLNPSSIDYASYVAFLGQVAALPDPPNAIEIWNEMNISREWPAGQISPSSYVENMLKPAYQAIKAANPNIMVITGAPAPTGFYGGGCGGGGCDDAPYIAGMMAAGAGSYSDCIGVHYNEGIMPPAATSGDPRGNGGHYTRYFQGMINAYVGAGAGQLCFTELGYLSGEEWGYVPQGFLWRAPFNLTVGEHAQYLAEAVSLGANSGRVRMIIVFNVDFTTWGDDPQAGYAMIRPDGSCPSCILLGQVMGQ